MENFIVNDRVPVNTMASNLDTEVEFIDPKVVYDTEAAEARRINACRGAARQIRLAGRNRPRKYMCFMYLKKLYPNISLKQFCEMYVKSQNQDSIEDTENNSIAGKVEQDYLFGKARQRRALRHSGMSRKAARKTVRKKKIIRKKVGGAVRKVGKAIGEATKRVAGATILLPLQPFKGTMVNALRLKGSNLSKRSSLIDIATQYYKKIVRGNHFEELPDDWYEDDPMFYEPMESFDEDYVVGATIATIVTAIVSFIKKAKQKKEKGIPMTEVEKVTAKGAEQFIKKVEAKTGKDLSKPSPITEAAKGQLISEYKVEGGKTTTYIIIGLVAAFVIYLASK